MKSIETYKVLRTILSPWFKAHGFIRTKPGALSWVKPIGTDFYVIWFQTESAGFNPPLGCSFTMEFQISPLPHLGAYGAGCTRHRLPNVLTDGELECVREMQNEVRSKLEKPTPDHWIYKTSQSSIDYYLSQFDQIRAWTDPNYKNLIWFQYKDVEDVRFWAGFILRMIPEAVSRIEHEHLQK